MYVLVNETSDVYFILFCLVWSLGVNPQASSKLSKSLCVKTLHLQFQSPPQSVGSLSAHVANSSQVLLSSAPPVGSARDASDGDSDEIPDVDWEVERDRESGAHVGAAPTIPFSHYATDFQSTDQLAAILRPSASYSCTFECTWIVPLNSTRINNVSIQCLSQLLFKIP